MVSASSSASPRPTCLKTKITSCAQCKMSESQEETVFCYLSQFLKERNNSTLKTRNVRVHQRHCLDQVHWLPVLASHAPLNRQSHRANKVSTESSARQWRTAQRMTAGEIFYDTGNQLYSLSRSTRMTTATLKRPQEIILQLGKHWAKMFEF